MAILKSVVFCCACFLRSTSGIVERESSVSLTIEGGVSLVGPQCPGNVSLFCEGANLTILQWNYITTNDNSIIASFSINDPPFSFSPPNPAFIVAELLSIQPAPDDPRFAVFNSTLTVSLPKLREQGVRNISCGALGTVERVINMFPSIVLLQPTVPEMPIATAVTATYRSGMLSSVTVSWKKLEVCPEFEGSLYYKLILTGHSPVRVNQTSCGDTLCVGTIDVTAEQDRYRLSMISYNDNGSSEIHLYAHGLERQSNSHFKSNVTWKDNCQAEVQCKSAGGLNNDVSCTVQFGTETGNSTQITTTIDTPFALLGLTCDTTYQFQFSVPVRGTLLIVNTFQSTSVTTDTGGDAERTGSPNTGLAAGFGVTVVLILVVAGVVIITLSAFVVYYRKTKFTISDSVTMSSKKQ